MTKRRMGELTNPCRHCETRPMAKDRRGLCSVCYRNPEIRNRYEKGKAGPLVAKDPERQDRIAALTRQVEKDLRRMA